MKKTLFFLMILWLVTSCGADRNLHRGEKFLALGEYYDAANEFRQAYQKTPAKERTKRGQIARKMAICYDKSLQSARALAAWRNAIRYQQADTADRLAFAQTLMKNGNYREAEEQFQLVLDSLPHDKLARDGLFAARKAPDIKQLGSRYTVKRMEVFNSRRADYCPMLFGDEYDQLYFTSTRNEALGDELSGITGTKPGDIFYSQKDDKGKWSKIVKSSRSDAAWGKAAEVKLTGDTLSSYAHPAISPDGEWLYFTSDMPGGKGGLDIWRVRITPAGYGGVENLGEPVNTPGDEAFPTFRPNGDLYFSSNGHPGLGGLDIFIAKVGRDGRYHLSHPGYPLNSQGDDFGMTFEGPYNRGFFSSNRGDARGWDHIYSFINPEIMQTVKGWVYEMDGYELPAAQVYIIGDDGTNEKMSVHSDGSFTKVLDPGVSYLFLATCKGYLNHQEQVKALVNPKESRDTTLQFALANISAPTLIDNIFYDEYNKRLSQRRAEAVVAYLIAHGIAADRLTPVGYGKERPKKIKKKLTVKYQWLKEGDVLTEDFIKALKDKKKEEICNQLNRRTEFSVLRTTYDLFDKNGKLKETPKPKKTEDKQDDGGVYFDLQ